MKKVIVIVGPTGSGKTALSIALAKKLNAEIINGDSVQIYQGLDIGSAKIKPGEMEHIPHHLLSIRSPKEPYSVYEFQKDVRDLLKKDQTYIIVGGTGLYIKAALYNYEFNETGRSIAFEETLQELSNEEIYQKLIALDPEITIDSHNRRRLLRAYEQAMLGHPRSTKQKKDEPLYEILLLYLDLDRDLLENRLQQRLKRQLNEGFIEEVSALLNQDIHINAIGYKEIERYLSGDYTLEEAKNDIIKASKRLAKKQKTWFKNQMQAHVLDATSHNLLDDALTLCYAFLNQEEKK